MPSIHQILTLARVPNLPTVWSNVLMAFVMAGGAADWRDMATFRPGPPLLLWLALLGGTLLYAGGCTLNDAFDARWDRAHKPDRLIPSGAVSELSVWLVGGIQMLVGWLLLVLIQCGSHDQPCPLLAPLILPSFLAGAILLYDFRHKESPWSVVVMGACRALLVLAVAQVFGLWGPPVLPVVVVAVMLWIYIILLSLLARREARPGGSFLRLLRPKWSVGRWVGEMLAAIPLLDALLILLMRPQRWPVALICLLLWPLCRLLQRKYAAT